MKNCQKVLKTSPHGVYCHLNMNLIDRDHRTNNKTGTKLDDLHLVPFLIRLVIQYSTGCMSSGDEKWGIYEHVDYGKVNLHETPFRVGRIQFGRLGLGHAIWYVRQTFVLMF